MKWWSNEAPKAPTRVDYYNLPSDYRSMTREDLLVWVTRMVEEPARVTLFDGLRVIAPALLMLLKEEKR